MFETPDNVPASELTPFRVFPRGFRDFARRLVVRPMHASRPPHPVVLANRIFATALSLIVFGVIIVTGHVTWSVELAYMALLASIACSVAINISDTETFTAQDIFYVISLMTFDPAECAVVFLVCGLVRFITGNESWVATLFHVSGVLMPGVCGMVTMWAVSGWYEPTATWNIVGISLVLFIGTNVHNEFSCALSARMRRPSASAAIAEQPSLGSLVRESVTFLGTHSLVMVPMSTLGVFAWQREPLTFVFILAPLGLVFAATRRMAQLAEARERMHTDQLTKLANRPGFAERALVTIAAANGTESSIALIMGDLDNFKRINDKLGHLTGDEVLHVAAQAFIRSRDAGAQLVGRYGGEEFVVLVEGRSPEEVTRLAECIRQDVESSLEKYGTTISLGVAYFEPHDRLESLIDRADKALYAAKYAGKNRVFHKPAWSDSPIPGNVTHPSEHPDAA